MNRRLPPDTATTTSPAQPAAVPQGDRKARGLPAMPVAQDAPPDPAPSPAAAPARSRPVAKQPVQPVQYGPARRKRW